jgi:hypothetical protein
LRGAKWHSGTWHPGLKRLFLNSPALGHPWLKPWAAYPEVNPTEVRFADSHLLSPHFVRRVTTYANTLVAEGVR